MRPLNLVFQIVIWFGGLIALGMLHDRYAEKPWIRRWWVKVGAIPVALLLLLFVFLSDDLLKGIGPATWPDAVDWIISNGYVPHSIETVISVDQNWINGETKSCKSYLRIPQSATFFRKGFGYVGDSFYCDDGPMHRVNVTLYGRLNQPEHTIAYWQCTRNAESFTCRQVGAE
jgi:hypothetical protein